MALMARADTGISSSFRPEAVPLMSPRNVDNNHQPGNGVNAANETVIDMDGSPVCSGDIPPDLDVEAIVNLIPAQFDQERDVCRTMFASIVRNNNVDTPQKVETRFFRMGSQRNAPVATMTFRTDLQFLTLLQWCAVTDLHYLIEPLVKLGADLTQITRETKLSLLMIAAQYKNENFFQTALRSNSAIAEKLLSHINTAKETVFEVVCHESLSNLATSLLVDFGSYYALQNGKGFPHFQKALSTAIRMGNTKVATELISSNAPINVKDRTGNEPLVQAVSRRRAEIIQALLERSDCDVNVVGSTRDTPLMLAAQGEDTLQIMNLLLASDKIEINKITETGIKGPKTALSEASRLERLENMDVLLSKGAQIIAKDDRTTCNSLQVAIKAKRTVASAKLLEQLMGQCVDDNRIDETYRKGFEDVLMQSTVNEDSHLLEMILNHAMFGTVVNNLGGQKLLWRGLMRASEKGLKHSVLAYLNVSTCPKVTQNCDLEDLACNSETFGDTPLHRMASTCLDSEIMYKIACISNPNSEKEGANSYEESTLYLDPNWLMLQSNCGKTVLEYMSNEKTLISYLRLHDFEHEKVKWVDSYPKDDPQLVFKHPVCNMDRKVLHQCMERFPEASQLLLNSMVIACGWGIHDENFQLLLNWKVMNEAMPSSNPCCSGNFSGEQHSDALVVASKNNPDLLSNPVMKLLQTKHWYKLSVHFFRAQILTATLLAILVTFSIISWKNGDIKAPVLFFILFVTSACLLAHVTQLVGSFRKYVTQVYNWLQVLLYAAIFLQTCVALSIMDSGDSSANSKQKIKEDFYSTKSWFSFLILFAWLNLFAILQKSILLGIYIIMFKNALFSFISIVVPLSLLLSSFGLTFYALYSDASGTLEEENGQNYIMKILSMTIGSVDGDAMGSDSDSPFYNPRFFLMLAFVVMITIITFNLLTGIVIIDVEQATRNSELYLMQLRIQVIAETEVVANLLARILPCREWLVFDDIYTIISPNQPKSIWHQFLSHFEPSKNAFMSDETITKELLQLCRN